MNKLEQYYTLNSNNSNQILLNDMEAVCFNSFIHYMSIGYPHVTTCPPTPYVTV